MKLARHFHLTVVLAILTVTGVSFAKPPTGGMVATVHPLATDAGVDALAKGGNAVDAAVAAALTVGVVDGHNSGIGGGCLILIHRADGEVVAIDGRETAPAAATQDMFIRDGKALTKLSQVGPLASGVPGALAAYDLAVKRHGGLALAELIRPAAEIAKDGFRVDEVYARRLRSVAALLAKFEGSRQVLLKEGNQPLEEGDILKQRDLARTYRGVADEGVEYFYRGPVAKKIAAWMRENGGLITEEDFANYQAVVRRPVRSTYRGHTVYGFPPPSSGGIHIAQMLNMLQTFDLKEIHRTDRAKFIHVIAESMKRAFADRAHWLGDADFAKVPRGLTDQSYARDLAQQIDPKQATHVAGHGTPPRAMRDFFGKHTTHIAAADDQGNWVGITATINTTFGSKVIVPGTGVPLNNEMDDFSIAPGVPNAFGLIGAQANAIAPGKRPLSSMSPTIVAKDGRPVLSVGAAGGPRIISQTLLTIIRHLDLNMSVKEALSAPRFHHQWSPDVLFVDQSLDESIVGQLRQLGHDVQRRQYMGVTQAVGRSTDGDMLVGAHDPNVPGKAAGR